MVFRFYYSLATWEKHLLKSMDMIDNQIKKLLRRMVLSCGRWGYYLNMFSAPNEGEIQADMDRSQLQTAIYASTNIA